MRNTTINVSFNTEKLDALKLPHGKKWDTDLQGELNDTVQKLYEKYVPQATREYIDDKVAREISTRERTRRADRTVRRGGVPAGRIRNRMITRIKKTESPVIHDIPV